MQENNFNYDNSDILVEHLQEMLLRQSIEPDVSKIKAILRQDGIRDHRDFVDKYGSTCFDRFINIYTW